MKTRFLTCVALLVFAASPGTYSSANAQVRQNGRQSNRAARADLKVHSFQTAGQARFRDGKLEVPFRMTIKNIGTVASQDNIVNGIRISNQYRWSGIMQSVEPAGSRVIEGVLKIDPPPQTNPPRDLHLIAMTDAPIAAADTSVPRWGREQESNERNNTKALGVGIPDRFGLQGNSGASNGKRPGRFKNKNRRNRDGVGGGGAGPVDLVVERFVRTDSVQYRAGKIEIPVQIEVRNRGSLASPANIVNGITYGMEYRWSGIMKSVPAGEKVILTGVVKIPDAGKLLKGRTLRLVAMADAPIAGGDTSIPLWGRIQETDENNNKRSLNVKVPGGLGLATEKPGSSSGRLNRRKKRR